MPNFAYVYGGFKCSPPLIDPQTKKVTTWCLNNTNPVNYVLYENIAPSISISKYIESCTGTEFINVYLQILYALPKALKEIDYTHYDLHYENILIRNPHGSQPFQIQYDTENGVEYITSTVISTIIDYGFSHIRTSTDGVDQHFGRSDFTQYSVFPYRSWIMHDLYKLLMFSMLKATKSNNQSVFNETVKIFRFFNRTDDPIAAINAQIPLLFAFPLSNETNTFTINNLSSHIRSICMCDFITDRRSNDPSLNCETLCLDESTILNKMGLNLDGPVHAPNNILEFYDVYTRLNNEGKYEDKKHILESFPYFRRIEDHINTMYDIFDEMTNDVIEMRFIDIRHMSNEQILDRKTLRVVQSTYSSITSLIDRIATLKFYTKIGDAVSKIFREDWAIAHMNHIMNQIQNTIEPYILDAKKILNTNRSYIDSIQSNTQIQAAIRHDPQLNWYWVERKQFDVILDNLNTPSASSTSSASA